MKGTNQQKWDYYKGILEKKAALFILKLIVELPEKVFEVYPVGSIKEMFITGAHYSFEFKTYHSGKKPKNEDVIQLKEHATSEIEFKPERVYLNYYYYWGDGSKASSAINFSDIAKGRYFLTKEEAELKASEVRKANQEEKDFQEKHKKDVGYDYNSNGYKFLGWQNGWKNVYFDAEGNQTTDRSKAKSFGYSKEDYPEYWACRESKHRTIEVSHNRRGSENTVSCPECKIYWKYDCSD